MNNKLLLCTVVKILMNYLCKCGETFDSENDLNFHIVVVCRSSEPLVTKSKKRKREIISEEMYRCVCGSVYDTRIKLMIHKKNSCIDPNVLVYKCVCNKLFVTKQGYFCHRRKTCPLIPQKVECTCRKIYCDCST